MTLTIFVNIGEIPNPGKGLLGKASSQEKVLGLHGSQLPCPGFTQVVDYIFTKESYLALSLA